MRDDAQTTMYARNARGRRAGRRATPGWHPALAALVERDYAFLTVTYGGDGWLFRGIERGLAEALASGAVGLNRGDHALAALERETGVIFVSQDLSDALAVSRLWQAPPDGALLVIAARAFAAAHAAGAAAVLGFADPGVVFRYPCFAAPIALAALGALVVHPAHRDAIAACSHGRLQCPLLAPDAGPNAGSRAAFEAALGACLAARGFVPARPVPSDSVPRALP